MRVIESTLVQMVKLFNEIKWKHERTFRMNEDADYLWSPRSTNQAESALIPPFAIIRFNSKRPELDCATVAHKAWMFAANTAAVINAPARHGLDSSAGNVAPSATGPSTAVPPVAGTSPSNVAATSAELPIRTRAPRSPRINPVGASEELVATRIGYAEVTPRGDLLRQLEKPTSAGTVHSATEGGMSPPFQGR